MPPVAPPAPLCPAFPASPALPPLPAPASSLPPVPAVPPLDVAPLPLEPPEHPFGHCQSPFTHFGVPQRQAIIPVQPELPPDPLTCTV